MKYYDCENQNAIILRDYLARDRTMLANERTLLAYIRTSLGLFSSGLAGVKFLNEIPAINIIGLVFLFIAPIMLVYGIVRFFAIANKLKTIPNNSLIKEK